MLLRQIARHFGPPSDLVRERISQADPDTLMYQAQHSASAWYNLLAKVGLYGEQHPVGQRQCDDPMRGCTPNPETKT